MTVEEQKKTVMAMKKVIMLVGLLLGMVPTVTILNTMGADFRVIYDFEYTKDSVNSIKGRDILYLEISEKASFCFSYYSYNIPYSRDCRYLDGLEPDFR